VPRGLYFVFSNCTDPKRTAEFNRWYSHVHLPVLRPTRGLVSARRFCIARPQPGQPQYLALYEFEASDLKGSVEDLGRQARREPPGLRPDCMQSVARHLYREIPQGEFQPMADCNYPSKAGGGASASRPNPREGVDPPARTTNGALYIVLSNCGDPKREEEFNRWYSYIHVPDLAPARGIVRATRWRNLEPEKGPSTYAALYEFKHDDLVAALVDFQRLGSRTINGRIIDCMQTVGMSWFWEVDADAYAPER